MQGDAARKTLQTLLIVQIAARKLANLRLSEDAKGRERKNYRSKLPMVEKVRSHVRGPTRARPIRAYAFAARWVPSRPT